MDRGAIRQKIDLFKLYQEDAWERTSRLLAMLFNTSRTEPRDCKQPIEFNPLAKERLKAGGEAVPGEYEDYPWAEPAGPGKEATNGIRKID